MQTPKQAVRASVRERVSRLTEAKRAQYAQQITRMIADHPLWQAAHCVLLFASLTDEIDTTALIEAARNADKEVVLPVVKGATLALRLYAPGQTTPGSYGIMEPTGADCRPIHEADIDLAIIPGVAFTRQGARLGRGKGFYDRLLPQLACPRFGLAYPEQIVETLPTDVWDVTLDGVFTL